MPAIVVTRSAQAAGAGFIGLYTYTTGYNRRYQQDYSMPVWTSIKHKIGQTSDAVRIYKRVSLEKPESVTDIRYHVGLNDEKVMQSRLWNIRALLC